MCSRFKPYFVHYLLDIGSKETEATTNAPDIRTRFLIMYCPSRVGTNGIEINETDGSITNGKNVPAICSNNNRIPNRSSLLSNKQIPIRTSQTPKTGTNNSGGIKYTVLLTNSVAELTPNGFNMPNQINTIERLYRNRSILYVSK